MASSTLSSRLLTRPRLEGPSGLSVYRHHLLPTPTHDILDTAATPQLIAATILHLKSVSARGYFKPDNIANLITSPLSILTFYCLMASMAFHTKTVTPGLAYMLGLAISLVTIFGTYNTIPAMMIGTYLPYTSGPSVLLASSSDMGPDSGLSHGHSPGVDCMQEEDNAAKKQQHTQERSMSKTNAKPYKDLYTEGPYTLKAGEDTKRQQDNTIPYVLDAQHESSKIEPTTYKSITPNLNTGHEPNMKHNSSPQIPAMQPKESTFQMTLRNAMHRSKRPSRTMKSRMSTSVQEYSSEDSYFTDKFQTTVCSEDETRERNSGTSTPDSECSTSTTESDFQAGLRMKLGSACGTRKRGRKGRRLDLSVVEMSQESEFQMRFREAVWPGAKSRRGIGTLGSETGGEDLGL